MGLYLGLSCTELDLRGHSPPSVGSTKLEARNTNQLVSFSLDRVGGLCLVLRISGLVLPAERSEADARPAGFEPATYGLEDRFLTVDNKGLVGSIGVSSSYRPLPPPRKDDPDDAGKWIEKQSPIGHRRSVGSSESIFDLEHWASQAWAWRWIPRRIWRCLLLQLFLT